MTIKFKPDPKKIIEIILWFANNVENISFHKLLKLLFFADIYHLNKYGRPIVGDQYHAMQYGPVASLTYDILKKEALAWELLEDTLPFDNTNKTIDPLRPPNLDYLSKSDIESLEYALDKYGSMEFKSLTDITHEHPAWVNASQQSLNSIMKYEDFLNIGNEGILNDKDNLEHLCMG